MLRRVVVVELNWWLSPPSECVTVALQPLVGLHLPSLTWRATRPAAATASAVRTAPSTGSNWVSPRLLPRLEGRPSFPPSPPSFCPSHNTNDSLFGAASWPSPLQKGQLPVYSQTLRWGKVSLTDLCSPLWARSLVHSNSVAPAWAG